MGIIERIERKVRGEKILLGTSLVFGLVTMPMVAFYVGRLSVRITRLDLLITGGYVAVLVCYAWSYKIALDAVWKKPKLKGNPEQRAFFDDMEDACRHDRVLKLGWIATTREK